MLSLNHFFKHRIPTLSPRLFVLLFLSFGLFFVSPDTAHGQEIKNSCVVTRVGSPNGQPVLPPGCQYSGGGVCQLAVPPQILTFFKSTTDIEKKIKDEFGLTVSGFSLQYTKWIYEDLYTIKDTNFIKLIAGEKVRAKVPEDSLPIKEGGYGLGNNVSSQVGCFSKGDETTVVFDPSYAETSAKILLLHELSHGIQSCRDEAENHFFEAREYINPPRNEDYITNYAKEVCLGAADSWNEDYAEMLAYYLKIEIKGFVSAKCGSNESVNPYLDPAKTTTKHKAMAEKITGGYACVQDRLKNLIP